MWYTGRARALSSQGHPVTGRTKGWSLLLSLSPLYFYSLKLECEKLATEKTEIQRHYVMVSEFHLKGEGWCGISSEPSKDMQGCFAFPLLLGYVAQP